MDLSIVVPLLNEDESLPELCGWIESVMNKHGYSYEVILIDDGSVDCSWSVIQEIGAKNPCFKGIKFQRNYGKSAALNEGFKAAQGDVIITMDADMQDSPDEIPELSRLILEEGYDMVSGWKKKRYDNTLTKNIPSKLFNAVARSSSGIRLHDFNCGLKAYRKKFWAGQSNSFFSRQATQIVSSDEAESRPIAVHINCATLAIALPNCVTSPSGSSPTAERSWTPQK